MDKRLIERELIIRELERRYENERKSLTEYMKTIFQHIKPNGIQNFHINWHHEEIALKLNEVLEGKCRRLIINIPPGHSKTEEITKCFPTWALGNYPNLRFILTWYSSTLTQWYSQEAKDYYKSDIYKAIFPRSLPISKKQDTKDYWKLEWWGEVYATGFDGTITGKRANIFIIDDPIKPNEAATSETMRKNVNENYGNTVVSRLADPLTSAVIIVMQRTHEEDLVGYLLELKEKGMWDDWDVLSFPAYAVQDEKHRKRGEALDTYRFPVEALRQLQKGMPESVFECQYQQNPNSEVGAEFKKEWYKYHNYQEVSTELWIYPVPKAGRIFTYCDPAFTEDKKNDFSSITTVKLHGEDFYILKQDNVRVRPEDLEDILIDHLKTFTPEILGVEKRQAQVVVGASLRSRMLREWLTRTMIKDVLQPWDKLSKIRSLIPLYRNGQIYHPQSFRYESLTTQEEKEASLEWQLNKFPRGKKDDAPDSLQWLVFMVQEFMSAPPIANKNIQRQYGNLQVTYDSLWRPIFK